LLGTWKILLIGTWNPLLGDYMIMQYMRLATFETGVKHAVEGQDDYGNLIVMNQADICHAAMGYYPHIQQQKLKKVTKKSTFIQDHRYPS
jgi:hypothetical protein